MNNTRILFTISCLFLLVASGDKTPTSIETNSSTSLAVPKINNPFENQLGALKKAQNIEGMLQKAADDKLDAIDKAAN